MNSIINGLPQIYNESGEITEYLQHIYNAVNDIEQIAKALKVLPQIAPYADNICGRLIVIRANINCIQNIPLKKEDV